MKKATFFQYFFEFRHLILIGGVLVVLAGLAAEFVPYLQGFLVSQGVVPQNAQNILFLLLALGVALLIDAFARCYLYVLANKVGFGIAKNIRTSFFEKLVHQPYQFFVQKRSGDMVFRANIFVYSVGNYLAKNLSDTAIGTTRFVIIFAYLFVLNWLFALALLGVYGLAMIFAALHSHRTYRIGKAYKHLELRRNSLILQNLDNIDTYLAYNDDFSYLKHYTRVDKTYHKMRNRYFFASHLFYPCLDFFVSLGTVVIYWLTFAENLGPVEVGVLVAMLTYANRMIMPIQQIAEGLAETIGTSATISKILNFVNKPKKYKHVAFKAKKFDVVCKKVSYKDPSTGAHFENLDLSVSFGQKVAIVGAYGNGKTAFANLLLGLDKPALGSVKFGEVDVFDIKKSNLANLICLASDNVGIFDATIFENVHFAHTSAKPKDVVLAIKKSGLLHFANALPKGVHTRISAISISEDIKQLIAFARVILKNTPVVIFDEFDRDLPPKNKAAFFESLKKFAKNKTIIYICQKPPKELQFDKIFRFQKNK